jgi:hypothetical protein
MHLDLGLLNFVLSLLFSIVEFIINMVEQKCFLVFILV